MRVHIISDIEGVAGIVKWAQTGGDQTLYHEARKLYTEEINAAVRGAKAAGAKEIVVMDCHGAGGDYTFNSLLPAELDPDCEFVVQNEWTEYTEFLEEGCDAALMSACTRWQGRPTACSRTPCPGRRGRTSGSTARSSARPASMRRSAGTGAARFCSSPATAPYAAKAASCSATA